jgi:hypothetical protein
MSNQTPARVVKIGSLIRTIRGRKIILDADLASIYGVPTKRLNEQARRNTNRFPSDFLFQLATTEAGNLKPQIATSSLHSGRSKLPYAFTENGAITVANDLNNPEAVRMSVFVGRAFVKIRELLGRTKELARQLVELEMKLTAQLAGHEFAIVDLLRRIMEILDSPPPPEPPRRRIGFHVETASKPEGKARKAT